MAEKPRETSQRVLDADQQRDVLDAALDLLAQEGLHATFIDKLASRSGLLAARIVMHFGGAERMIQALLDRELELMAGSVSAPALRFPGETLRDELEVLGRIILEQTRRHARFLRTILVEAMRNPQFAALFYRTFILRGRKLFTEFLEARQGRGEIRADIDIEAAAAFFLSALIFSLLAGELLGGKEVEKIEDERLIREVCTLFLWGVSPAPAPRWPPQSAGAPEAGS